MSEVITRPRASATKAPTRIGEAPAPAPAQNPPASESERKVAATGATLLGQAVALIGEEDGPAYAAALLELGQQLLLQAAEGLTTLGKPQDVFYFAAGACSGALAIERQDCPGSVHRHELITTAFNLLNNTCLSYDCDLPPCEEAAAAIEAGAHRFRDRPLPPIRRLGDAPVEGRYNQAQMERVLEFVAGSAHTLHHVLLMAQVAENGEDLSRLVDSAELMTRHIGASADAAVSGMVIGGFERWSYGPNFPRTGGAA